MDELLGNLLVSLFLTAVAYMAFPLIRLAINHGKFNEKRAKRIAIWNSVIVGAFFCVLTIGTSDGTTTWNAAPAVLYFFINRAILTDKKNAEAANKPDFKGITSQSDVSANTPRPPQISNADEKPKVPGIYNVSKSEFVLEKHTPPIIFCRKCGNKLIPDSSFCNICGTKVLKEKEE